MLIIWLICLWGETISLAQSPLGRYRLRTICVSSRCRCLGLLLAWRPSWPQFSWGWASVLGSSRWSDRSHPWGHRLWGDRGIDNCPWWWIPWGLPPRSRRLSRFSPFIIESKTISITLQLSPWDYLAISPPTPQTAVFLFRWLCIVRLPSWVPMSFWLVSRLLTSLFSISGLWSRCAVVWGHRRLPTPMMIFTTF